MKDHFEQEEKYNDVDYKPSNELTPIKRVGIKARIALLLLTMAVMIVAFFIDMFTLKYDGTLDFLVTSIYNLGLLFMGCTLLWSSIKLTCLLPKAFRLAAFVFIKLFENCTFVFWWEAAIKVFICIFIVGLPGTILSMCVFLVIKLLAIQSAIGIGQMLLFGVSMIIGCSAFCEMALRWDIGILKGLKFGKIFNFRSKIKHFTIFAVAIIMIIVGAVSVGKTQKENSPIIPSEGCAHTNVISIGDKAPDEKTFGFKDGKKCTDCEVIINADEFVAPIGKMSSGFEYEIHENGKSCTITGMGSCTDTELVIPSVIDGYLVAEITAYLNSDVVSVEFLEGIHVFYGDLFYECYNLKTVIIPSSTLSIPAGAFDNCTSLESITVAPENKRYISMSGIVYDKEAGSVLAVPNHVCGDIVLPDFVHELPSFWGKTEITSVVIPEGITYIGTNAFSGCTSLEKVTIPSSVTSIELGYGGAFNDCTNLSAFVVNEGNKNYYSHSGILYNKADNTIAWIPDNINGEITFPTALTEVSASSFRYRTGITSIKIDGTVSKIGSYAFCGCSALTTVTISANVTFIDDSAFADCSALSDIYFLGTTEQWNAIEKYYNWDSGTDNYTVHCTDGNITK